MVIYDPPSWIKPVSPQFQPVQDFLQARVIFYFFELFSEKCCSASLSWRLILLQKLQRQVEALNNVGSENGE